MKVAFKIESLGNARSRLLHFGTRHSFRASPGLECQCLLLVSGNKQLAHGIGISISIRTPRLIRK